MFDPNQLIIDSNSNAFDHTQDRFDAEYSNDFVDNTFQSNTSFTGYNEAYFGKDPLSQAHMYECPKFNKLIWIDAYVKGDGTLVDGHFRTTPDHTTLNNLNR